MCAASTTSSRLRDHARHDVVLVDKQRPYAGNAKRRKSTGLGKTSFTTARQSILHGTPQRHVKDNPAWHITTARQRQSCMAHHNGMSKTILHGTSQQPVKDNPAMHILAGCQRLQTRLHHKQPVKGYRPGYITNNLSKATDQGTSQTACQRLQTRVHHKQPVKDYRPGYITSRLSKTTDQGTSRQPVKDYKICTSGDITTYQRLHFRVHHNKIYTSGYIITCPTLRFRVYHNPNRLSKTTLQGTSQYPVKVYTSGYITTCQTLHFRVYHNRLSKTTGYITKSCQSLHVRVHHNLSNITLQGTSQPSVKDYTSGYVTTVCQRLSCRMHHKRLHFRVRHNSQSNTTKKGISENMSKTIMQGTLQQPVKDYTEGYITTACQRLQSRVQ